MKMQKQSILSLSTSIRADSTESLTLSIHPYEQLLLLQTASSVHTELI